MQNCRFPHLPLFPKYNAVHYGGRQPAFSGFYRHPKFLCGVLVHEIRLCNPGSLSSACRGVDTRKYCVPPTNQCTIHTTCEWSCCIFCRNFGPGMLLKHGNLVSVLCTVAVRGVEGSTARFALLLNKCRSSPCTEDPLCKRRKLNHLLPNCLAFA